MLKRTISAIIITKNEGRNLQDCLNTVRFCDEWIVVDSGSSDDTVNIAQRFGCHVIVTDDWPGFGVQKQRGLDAATSDWILSIDADERITAELAKEIRQVIALNNADGFYIARRSQFLGRWMNHGGWHPDRLLRLAKRDKVRFDLTRVHEKMLVNGFVAVLENPMLHYSYRSLDDVLTKQKTYALAGAARKIVQIQEFGREAHSDSPSASSHGSAHTVGILRALISSAWTFVRLFFFKLGFLDGWHGLVSAFAKSQETFWKYLAVVWPGDRSKN